MIENGLKDFQLQPSNQGTTFHPTLGGAWGRRFRIFLAIFSTVIWISYCPLSSELVFQCHDLEEWKELLETSPTPTNQACPPPGLLCPLYHRIGTRWPPHLEERLWGILPGIGDPEKKRFKHKDRSEDYRAYCHFLFQWVSCFLVCTVLRLLDTHPPLFRVPGFK